MDGKHYLQMSISGKHELFAPYDVWKHKIIYTLIMYGISSVNIIIFVVITKRKVIW